MSAKSIKEYYDEYKLVENDHDKALAWAQEQVNRDRDRPGVGPSATRALVRLADFSDRLMGKS
eukprot:CAMPEP_0205824430 /NCGR_PEP_ID=MMETSP0206-20130828/21013_1 /ASSEMBLY_ACC=CAM_ASM_000279 /TAXON_ID=36767 /ORGANISM="Euplotes focardii, Strain TN1" /LENGTH=62 /DNA_ID=CAMNT_0053122575 /DNA_START=26 /DNA_END=211 /DNA_ORIENTATION=-